tara:strand:- start:936 stop:1193 length:258 start_codon:yes stop_codon:yes gene_type:complete
MTKKNNDPFGFNKAINWGKLEDPKVLKELDIGYERRRKTMNKQITIIWGSSKQEKKTYKFKTEEQLKYFMMGVDEAEGWLSYEIK